MREHQLPQQAKHLRLSRIMCSTTEVTKVLLSVSPLYTYTSHLSAWELRQVLRPSRWTPLYLSVLTISVHTSVNYNSILLANPKPDPSLDRNNEYYLKLIKALSDQLSIPPTDLSKPDNILREITYFCSRLKWGSRKGVQVLELLSLVTNYLLVCVKPCYSKLVRSSEPHKT